MCRSSFPLMPRVAAFVGLALFLPLAAPPASAAGQAVKPAGTVRLETPEVPACSTLADYLSEDELRALRGRGLPDLTIAALALTADHRNVRIMTLAGQSRPVAAAREAAAVREVAARHRLDPDALLAAARRLLRDGAPSERPAPATARRLDRRSRVRG